MRPRDLLCSFLLFFFSFLASNKHKHRYLHLLSSIPSVYWCWITHGAMEHVSIRLPTASPLSYITPTVKFTSQPIYNVRITVCPNRRYTSTSFPVTTALLQAKHRLKSYIPHHPTALRFSKDTTVLSEAFSSPTPTPAGPTTFSPTMYLSEHHPYPFSPSTATDLSLAFTLYRRPRS